MDQTPTNPANKSNNTKKREPVAEAPRGPFAGGGVFLLIALVLTLVFFSISVSSGLGRQVPYGFFRKQLTQGNVKEVVLKTDTVNGVWLSPPADPENAEKVLEAKFFAVLPTVEDRELIELFSQHLPDGRYKTERPAWTPLMSVMFASFAMLIVVLGFAWFVFRRSVDPMGAGGMVSNFIRSPAKRFQQADQQNTFEDVAGMEQAKRELQEIVEFLKNPAKFQRLGAQIPKGVLLMGPPGTGKTLMARATAGEAGVPFFSINGSEFIQMFVGVGASRVRDLFRTAKDASPAILYIDEIDAVGRVRGAGVGGGHDEREQTLNQILGEMDGFQQTEAVIVLASTNRPDVLDPALLRPGRFDRHVNIERPNKQGRIGILKVHTRKVPLSDKVDLERIAGGTIGFSGADLRNLVNEAALNAARYDKACVDDVDFELAKDRVLMGVQQEELISDHEKRMTAYHEAGHALIAWVLPELEPVHKVTIVPRGRALGVTQLQADEEKHSYGERYLHNRLAFIMGGRVAEKMIFGEYSGGAESDLQRATSLARKMVAHWGMSERIGPVAFRQTEEHPFLGREMHEAREFSEQTANTIDDEIRRILLEASNRAEQLLTEQRSRLDSLAEALLKTETVTREDMTTLLGAREVVLPPGMRPMPTDI